MRRARRSRHSQIRSSSRRDVLNTPRPSASKPEGCALRPGSPPRRFAALQTSVEREQGRWRAMGFRMHVPHMTLTLTDRATIKRNETHYGPPYCPAAAAAATAAATAEATVRLFSRRRPLPASAAQLPRVGRISRCLPLSRAIAHRGRVAWARAEARALPAAMIATCAARRWAAARAGAAPPPIAARTYSLSSLLQPLPSNPYELGAV